MSNCHISNQVARHCNEETTYCPECESWMEEKQLTGGAHWLECENEQCGHEIDLSEEV